MLNFDEINNALNDKVDSQDFENVINILNSKIEQQGLNNGNEQSSDLLLLFKNEINSKNTSIENQTGS